MAEVGNKQKITLQFVGRATRDKDGKMNFPLVLSLTDEKEAHVGMYSGLEISGSALLKKDQILDILQHAAKPDEERSYPLFVLTIED